MKKIAVGFICLGFLFCASSCWAAYVILLKDGRSITTHEYWEEGDQIKIKQYGGVVGINKDNVLSIEDADVKTIVVKSPPETEPEEGDEKAKTPQQKGKGRKEKTGDVNEEKPGKRAGEKGPKEKNPLLKEFDALKKLFDHYTGRCRPKLGLAKHRIHFTQSIRQIIQD